MRCGRARAAERRARAREPAGAARRRRGRAGDVAGGAAGAVDVGGDVLGAVRLHDPVQGGEVQAARRDVGREEHGAAARLRARAGRVRVETLLPLQRQLNLLAQSARPDPDAANTPGVMYALPAPWVTEAQNRFQRCTRWTHE